MQFYIVYNEWFILYIYLRGKIISPQSIAIATSAGNQQGKEGEILKAAIPYALVYVCITGIIVYLFS